MFSQARTAIRGNMEILEGEKDMVSVRKRNKKILKTLQSYLQIAQVKHVKIPRFTLCSGVEKFCSSCRKYSYFAGPGNWKSRGKGEYPPYPQIHEMVLKYGIQQNITKKCYAETSKVSCRLRINNL